MDLFDSARRLPPAGSTFSWDKGLEQLEPRVFLSNTPLPNLADMTEKQNTLVRMETDYGTIDMEMFDVAGPSASPGAPNTVANFLNYVRKGEFDLSFFHRYALNQNKRSFVLQGGGFKWDDTEKLVSVDAGDPIDNEYDAGRSNIAKTIAMARLGGDENSATSQFFFNLRDNSSILDTGGKAIQPGQKGFCVFGKVLDKRSWDVITKITALTTENFDNVLQAGGFEETPTKHDLDPGTAPTTAELVNITDVEIIKADHTELFYRLRAAYPEGYRGPASVESLELVNPGTDNEVQYQVIIRYEKGLGRDTVISTGTLDPNVSLHIPVNDFNDPSLNLVRDGAPYAFEVWATAPLGAALNHQDFGSSTSESFVNVEQAGPLALQTWAFGGTATPIDAPADADIIRRPFLVWDNLGFEPANVTITFTLQTGGRVVWTRKTDPMRRDGLEVFNLKNVTRDIASIRVEADQKIVAAFTVYDTIVNPLAALPPLSTNNGFTSTGMLNGGLSDGVVAGAMIGAAGSAYVSFVNDSDSGASVTLSFVRTGHAVTTTVLPVPGRGRAFLNLRKPELGLPVGEQFTILFHSPLVDVAGEYVATLNGDTASTAFAEYGSSQSIFADGRYDPSNADESEILSLYNPYVSKTVSVSITFNFADDKIQTPTTFDLAPQSRLDISTASLSAIVAKINSGAQFKNYSIIVNVSLDGGGTGGSVGAGGLVAQLTRYNLTSTITTAAGLYQLSLPLDSPVYAQST